MLKYMMMMLLKCRSLVNIACLIRNGHVLHLLISNFNLSLEIRKIILNLITQLLLLRLSNGIKIRLGSWRRRLDFRKNKYSNRSREGIKINLRMTSVCNKN
jgi:hypothetical protein